MAQVRQHLLTLLLGGTLVWPLAAQKFFPDDPLLKEPPPMPAKNLQGRKLSDVFDLFYNLFAKPGERNNPRRVTPARGINTLGEAPDSPWYTNRHYRQRLSIEELKRAPGGGMTPDASAPWKVVAAKTEGVTPGFRMKDAQGRLYFVKFDPQSNPEMATGAEAVSGRLLYALGYHVPDNYLITFRDADLTIAPDATITDEIGRKRSMTSADVAELLYRVPRDRQGRYRAIASLALPGKPLGPFRWHGTRADDPNDVVPHEHRRELRGLRVFSAWINHDDSRAINTQDTLAEEGGIPHVRHYLLDFGSTLGSGSTRANSPRSGSEYMFTWRGAASQFATLGLYVPRWARARYPGLPSVGRFEARTFDPETWVPEYPNPAFDNLLPDDAFWAARQVMHFSDEEIRAVVKTGQYSDPRAEQYLADCLIERRDKIGRAFLEKALPLDRFTVAGGRLVFEDLGLTHRVVASRNYVVQWSRFDNQTGRKTPIAGAASFELPDDAVEYLAADIHGGSPGKSVTVYLRRGLVVGIDRSW